MKISFLQKYKNFRANTKIFMKIDANSGIIIDVEYLGNEASDLILFTKEVILK
jgi:hypothetical protein